MSTAIPDDEVARITADLIGVLKTVYDPEIPVDIYELGLIYKVDLDDDRHLTIDMTLTAPGCPVAGEMPGWVENAALLGRRHRRTSRSTWSLTRRGIRAACRKKRRLR